MNYTNNPYMSPYIYQPMNYGNSYMQQPAQPPRTTPAQQPVQVQQPVQINPIGLQGKSVDSVDVVKATDIPLDGSVSYFPLTDGTAIVTKQLQSDGTSKTVIYKPINEDDSIKEIPKYITADELDEKIKSIKFPDYKEDIKKINRKIEDVFDDIENINKSLKKKKED